MRSMSFITLAVQECTLSLQAWIEVTSQSRTEQSNLPSTLSYSPSQLLHWTFLVCLFICVSDGDTVTGQRKWQVLRQLDCWNWQSPWTSSSNDWSHAVCRLTSSNLFLKEGSCHGDYSISDNINLTHSGRWLTDGWTGYWLQDWPRSMVQVMK